jgi:sugar/nucleoside kinase (ribokinase family)
MPDARPEAIVAGHICLDVIPEITHRVGLLSPGQLIEVGPARFATGGAVANTGQALHRLGVKTTLVGKLGDDPFARRVLELLRGYGPELAEAMRTVPGETTSYTIVVSPPQVDRLFLHCPGANATFDESDIDFSDFDGAKVFHFGYPPLMESLYKDGGESMCGIFSLAKERGVTTSLDMAAIDPHSKAGMVDWRAWLKRVLPEVDIFAPSIEETLFMLGREAETGSPLCRVDVQALRSLCDELLTMGAAVVLLKLGDRGVYLRSTPDTGRLHLAGHCLSHDIDSWSGQELFTPCFRVDCVGTTGAGDCTIAGFLAELLNGGTPQQAATMAVAVGACSVEAPDAISAVPTRREVLRRIDAGWLRRPRRDQNQRVRGKRGDTK